MKVDDFAMTTVGRIIGIARGNTLPLDDSDPPPEAGEVFAEFLALYVHLAHRIVCPRLSETMGEKFAATLLAGTSVSAASFWEPPEEEFNELVGALLALLRERDTEYSGCRQVMSESNLPENQAGTVFGEFLEKLPERWRDEHRLDPLKMIQSKSDLGTGVEALKLETIPQLE